MSDQPDNIVKTLNSFGLNTNEAHIYLFLNENGARSALQLSRELKLARTKVYRLLEKLTEKGLVNERVATYGRKFEPTPPSQLQMLLLQREQEVQSLQQSLPLLIKQLSHLGIQKSDKSKVVRYQGVQGLKQVTWNSTKANNELRVFEIGSLDNFLPHDFSEEARREFVKNRVSVHQLTNHAHIPAWTEVQELVDKYWKCRYLDPSELKMEFEFLIYDDIVTLYNYQDQEIFCIEIHNPQLAAMQKQLFEFIWSQSKPMHIEKGGKATKKH